MVRVATTLLHGLGSWGQEAISSTNYTCRRGRISHAHVTVKSKKEKREGKLNKQHTLQWRYDMESICEKGNLDKTTDLISVRSRPLDVKTVARFITREGQDYTARKILFVVMTTGDALP